MDYHRTHRATLARGRAWPEVDLHVGQDVAARSSYVVTSDGDATYSPEARIWDRPDYIITPSPWLESTRAASRGGVAVTQRRQRGQLVGTRMQRKPHIDVYALRWHAPADKPQARPITAAAHA
eukprot:4173205-Pyramimonas_sp.AAC.1